MNILIFNIRDIKNPSSGGAEVFTHEISKRWVAMGNSVTMIVSNYPGGNKNETIDGVEIIRIGNIFTVVYLAKFYYKYKLHNKPNIVIDEYTLRPFLTPRFVEEPKIFLCHEFAREKYFYELPPLVSHIFYYFIEPSWIKCYRDLPVITVSPSTRKDLIDFGFKNIHLVPEGINFKPLPNICEKEKEFTMIFVGLLKNANLVDHAIEAFRIVSKKIPTSKLWIVGRGKELEKLRKLSVGLNITFFGYVSEDKKLDLMRRSHVILVPAIREGWGLVVTEANACGTPAIGYNVPGLRDSIRDLVTGILTDSNPHSMANAIEKIYAEDFRNSLSKSALLWSNDFNWDNTAISFLKILEDYSTYG